MRIKTLPVSFKAGPEDGLEEGEFLVYPSTFTRTPDAYGDVIAKGAFLDSIQAWKDSGDVMPGMYLHDPNQIVAGAIDMGEDDHGWWVKGFFDDDPAAQRVYRLVKGRRLSSLSFAFDVHEEGAVELEDGTKANELRKLTPHEFSFLPKGFAANDDTSIVSVKSMLGDLQHDLKAGRVLSAKNEAALRTGLEKISEGVTEVQNVLAGVGESEDEGKANGSEPVKADDDPDGTKSAEEPTRQPSALTSLQIELATREFATL